MERISLLARIDQDFAYHAPNSDSTKQRHESVRVICKSTAQAVTQLCPEGRELALALTKLEEAMFWANAAIARAQDNTPAVVLT